MSGLQTCQQIPSVSLWQRRENDAQPRNTVPGMRRTTSAATSKVNIGNNSCSPVSLLVPIALHDDVSNNINNVTNNHSSQLYDSLTAAVTAW